MPNQLPISSTEDRVDAQTAAYQKMARSWELVESLLGGTAGMRDAGEKWLPREPREPYQLWENRRDRTVLFNAFKHTIKRHKSKPFSKMIQLNKELPEPLDVIERDADRSGRDLTQFASSCFESGLKYGKFHILIDFPRVQGEITLRDQRQFGIRPMFILVEAPQVIGWRSEVQQGGNIVLTEVRIREMHTRPKGRYGEEHVEVIRIYRRSEFEIWEKGPDDIDFFQASSGTHTFGEVPMVTVYFDYRSFFIAEPPFQELAELNLLHWQSSSDQRNILRFARVPMLGLFGFTEEEAKKIGSVGPNIVLRASSTESRAVWVEHTGKAIEAGERDLQRIEERMEIQGMQPMIQRTAQSTATGKILDMSGVVSDIQAWIMTTEAGLLQAYEFAARWVKKKLPDNFSVNIFSDFALTQRQADNAKMLIQMRKSREITRATFLAEMQRYGVLDEQIDLEEEQRLLDEDDEANLALGFPTSDDEEDDE